MTVKILYEIVPIYAFFVVVVAVIDAVPLFMFIVIAYDFEYDKYRKRIEPISVSEKRVFE